MKSFKTYTQERLDEKVFTTRFVESEIKDLLVPALEGAKKMGKQPLIYRGFHISNTHPFNSPVATVTTLEAKKGKLIGAYKRLHGFADGFDEDGIVEKTFKKLKIKDPVFATRNKKLAEIFGSYLYILIPVGNYTVWYSKEIDDAVAAIAITKKFGDNPDPKELASKYESKRNTTTGVDKKNELIFQFDDSRYMLFNLQSLASFQINKTSVKSYADVVDILEKIIADRIKRKIAFDMGQQAFNASGNEEEKITHIPDAGKTSQAFILDQGLQKMMQFVFRTKYGFISSIGDADNFKTQAEIDKYLKSTEADLKLMGLL